MTVKRCVHSGPYARTPARPHALTRRPPLRQVDFAALKQNLELSERTDFMNLKAENERLLGDIEKLKQRLREEISRTQAGVRLDLNLEKVRYFSFYAPALFLSDSEEDLFWG